MSASSDGMSGSTPRWSSIRRSASAMRGATASGSQRHGRGSGPARRLARVEDVDLQCPVRGGEVIPLGQGPPQFGKLHEVGGIAADAAIPIPYHRVVVAGAEIR